MTLDDLDDEDSAYVTEQKYVRRFNLVYKKICELKKASSRTGRIVEKKFKYSGKVVSFINRTIC